MFKIDSALPLTFLALLTMHSRLPKLGTKVVYSILALNHVLLKLLDSLNLLFVGLPQLVYFSLKPSVILRQLLSFLYHG